MSDVQAHQATYQGDKIKLAKHRFEQRRRLRHLRARNDVAVTDTRQCHKTEIAHLHKTADQVVHGRGGKRAEGAGLNFFDDRIQKSKSVTGQEISADRTVDCVPSHFAAAQDVTENRYRKKPSRTTMLPCAPMINQCVGPAASK